MARALICGPRLFLLDEPLAALDARLRREMQDFLKSVQRRTRVSFLVVTRDQDEAIALSDCICVMSHVPIEQIGTAEDVYYRLESRFVATVFGDNNLIDGCEVDGDGASVEPPFGTLALAQPSRLSGQKATLCVWPESLLPPRGALVIETQAGTVEFAGALTRRYHSTASGIALTMKATSHKEAPRPKTGQPLAVSVAPEGTALIPTEERRQ